MAAKSALIQNGQDSKIASQVLLGERSLLEPTSLTPVIVATRVHENSRHGMTDCMRQKAIPCCTAEKTSGLSIPDCCFTNGPERFMAIIEDTPVMQFQHLFVPFNVLHATRFMT